MRREVSRIKMERKLQKIYLKDYNLLGIARFMGNSLPNPVNNLFHEIHKIKCKYGHNDKKCETCEVKYKYCDCFLE